MTDDIVSEADDAGGGANDGSGNDAGGGDPGANDAGSPPNDANPSGDGGSSDEGVRAFPGAQGFGALVTGGRGGRVIKVTTLSRNGPGSLTEALNQDEPRIVVFEVSGTINGDFEIPYGNLTIAGQTAPGAGITILGRLSGAYEYGVDNIIVRHLRVRPVYDGSPGQQFDAIQFSRNSKIILDHVSASFGVDETIDLYESRDVTVQWSVIESSATNGHPEGQHNYGLINGPDGVRVSVHHNLFAHHKNRAPAIANGPAEVVNNLMYNVQHGFVHHNPASGPFNIEGNYLKEGNDANLYPFFFDDENDFDASDLGYFMADNFIEDPSSSCQGSVANPWVECSQDLLAPASLRSPSRFGFDGVSALHAAVSVQSSTDAYDAVLASAGAFPRDLVTQRSVQDTMAGTGAWGSYSIPNPMQGLQATQPPPDADNDGIADAWETSHALNPNDSSDNQTLMPSGYPAIEQYINELAVALLP